MSSSWIASLDLSPPTFTPIFPVKENKKGDIKLTTIEQMLRRKTTFQGIVIDNDDILDRFDLSNGEDDEDGYDQYQEHDAFTVYEMKDVKKLKKGDKFYRMTIDDDNWTAYSAQVRIKGYEKMEKIHSNFFFDYSSASPNGWTEWKTITWDEMDYAERPLHGYEGDKQGFMEFNPKFNCVLD